MEYTTPDKSGTVVIARCDYSLAIQIGRAMKMNYLNGLFTVKIDFFYGKKLVSAEAEPSPIPITPVISTTGKKEFQLPCKLNHKQSDSLEMQKI